MTGVQQWLPYAQQVSRATGVATGLLLALGQEETGLGTAGTGRVGYNIWGVKFTSSAPTGTTEQAGGFAAYPSAAAAAQDMIRVLSLPVYAPVRSAVGVAAQAAALADSPYNGAPYSQRQDWGQTLLQVYQQDGFGQYDAPGASAGSVSVDQGAGTVTVSGLSGSTQLLLLAAAIAALLVALVA